MNTVLVIGSGGRCHAIVDALHRSPSVGKIYCAEGNAGISEYAELVPVCSTDIIALRDWALAHEIDLTVVGPEVPLAMGIVDEFRRAGLPIFGHTQAATQIESNKAFAKRIMQKAGVPTAAYQAFDNYEEAVSFVGSRPLPAVIKYEGLAAGKGVVIAETLDEAQKALREMLVDKSFGDDSVIIEDFLTGPEFSLMCFVNGDKLVPMPIAQDHKRAFDGDKGPNTGGMGAYTPVPFITKEDERYALDKIMQPVAAEMLREGMPLTGVLYGGLIKTPDGIKVIEFNARFGDPETEVVLPLLQSDIYPMLHAVATGDNLPQLQWEQQAVLGVVLASKGYPSHYAKGAPIHIDSDFNALLYHMGTKQTEQGLVTNGGRVMMVVEKAPTLELAHERVEEQILKIHCDNLFFRHDIGHHALPTATIIDGKTIAEKIRKDIRHEVEEIAQQHLRLPSLAVILVGDDAASRTYVRGKVKACEQTGIQSHLIGLPATVSEEELLRHVEALNNDFRIDGILVQLPLPKHINTDNVIKAIAPEKDVDAFHPINVANLWNASTDLVPCTPKGIMYLLEQYGIDVDGKIAVVVGRSNIVGKPIAKLLLNANATVIMAHSHTRHLEQITRMADILVVAVGKKHCIKREHIKPGAVVIDVGITRDTDGHLYGDVDFNEAKTLASYITPVPGGVGPMTIAMLLRNTLLCYKKKMLK